MADILQKNKYVDPTTLNKSINIIDNIKQIDSRFDIYCKTRVRHYSLQDHTELVLKYYDKYFPRPIVIGLIVMDSFRIFLALHDIGKAPAYLSGNKNDQAKYTMDLFSDIRTRIKEVECFFLTLPPLSVMIRWESTFREYIPWKKQRLLCGESV